MSELYQDNLMSVNLGAKSIQQNPPNVLTRILSMTSQGCNTSASKCRNAACRWLFVPWEFARFNLLNSGSAQYGAHPWHWNLTQGLPTVAATLLPLALGGVCLTRGCDCAAALKRR